MTTAIERIARWLAALAPPPLRQSIEHDAPATLAEVLAAAHARAGWRGLILAGMTEWVDLLRAALRARIGGSVRITGGHRPHGRQSGTDGHGGGANPRAGGGLVSRLRNDIRLAFRSMNAARATTLIAVVTLALGIGVNTAVFSVLDSILFRPVPYAEADRLETLWTYTANAREKFYFRGGMSLALIGEWRKQTDLFDRVEAAESKSFIFEDERGAEMVSGVIVTPGLIAMLGVHPIAGRPFVNGDGQDGTDRLVLIGERFWRQRLQRDPNVVGRPITLDGERYTVIGILPRTFRYPNEAHDLWIPLDIENPPARTRPAPGPEVTSQGRAVAWRGPSLEPLVRLQPGLDRVHVNERALARGAELNAKAGGDGKNSAGLMPIGQVWDNRTERSLKVLGGAVLFLLLIVCANVANLTLSRSISRSRDRAVRTALGASRADLVREALVEYSLIGVIGALLGLGVARLAVSATIGVLPEAMTLSSLNAVDLDLRALGFLAAVSAMTVLIFGVPPAILSSRATVADALRRETRSSTGSTSARRFRGVLVVAEVALSLVLLIGAALMTRSLLKLHGTDIGMDTNGLLTLRLGLPAPGYSSVQSRELFVAELLDRLRRDSDVVSASAGQLPPEESQVAIGALEFGDRPGERTNPTLLRVYDVWPRFFTTAGIRIEEGREFHDRDIEGAAIVSHDFAARHWPGRSPVGMRFRVGESPVLSLALGIGGNTAPWRTIVGVAAEVRGMGEEGDSQRQEIYYPRGDVEGLSQPVRASSRIADYETIVIRSRQAGSLMSRLSPIVHGIDSSVVVSRTRLVEQQFADQIARPRTMLLMLSVFALFGLVLAAAGLYGVMSYLVAQRGREIGIRLALGATPREIGRLIFGRGLGLAAIGVALGLAGSYWLVRVMQTLLYEVEARDPVSVVLVSVVLLGTAALAVWRPARRAMRIDPMLLLRDE